MHAHTIDRVKLPGDIRHRHGLPLDLKFPNGAHRHIVRLCRAHKPHRGSPDWLTYMEASTSP
jgi:hypothetical protein